MADDIDRANDQAELYNTKAIQQARAKAAKIPQGVPGDCELCGEYFTRLVGGNCARCRDDFRLD